MNLLNIRSIVLTILFGCYINTKTIMKIVVENIKCGGCANSITSKLKETFNYEYVDVDVAEGAVIIDDKVVDETEVEKLLHKLGYPRINSVEGLEAAKTKAKSFVSCAIGRIKD